MLLGEVGLVQDINLGHFNDAEVMVFIPPYHVNSRFIPEMELTG